MSTARADAQNAFHDRLTRYVNGSFAARGTRLLSLASPRLAWRLEAADIVAQFRAVDAAREAAPGPAALELEIAPYTGSNTQALALMHDLAPLAPWLAGAYVHGSVATGEEIPYSDFDALVILRDPAFDSPATLARVAGALGRMRRHMIEYDPLQHHGWFVLAEADLAHYCQAWFPTALFPWSRSLLPEAGRRLRIVPRDSTAEYRAAFAALADSTLRQIEAGPPLGNAYRLKGLLSQFMLLPSLYLQARDGTAVFKRESFALAAADFPAALWSAMDRVSAARQAWDCRLTALQRHALTRHLALRPLVTRWVAPAVPAGLRRLLPADLWPAAAGLVRAMQARLG